MIYTYDTQDAVKSHMDRYDLADDQEEHLTELANTVVEQAVAHITEYMEKLFAWRS